MLTAIHQPLAALFGAIYRRIRFKKTKLFHPSHSKRPHYVSQRGLLLFMGQVDGLTLSEKTLNSWELIWRQSGGQTRQHNSLSFAVCLRCQPRTGASPSINLTRTHSARPRNLPHRPASLVSLSMSPFRCECASVCVCVWWGVDSGQGSHTRPCGVLLKPGERRRCGKRRLYSSLCVGFFLSPSPVFVSDGPWNA